MEKITAFEAARLVTQAMDQRGADYRDPFSTEGAIGCQYVRLNESGEPETPGCIVGAALFIHGLSLETLWGGSTQQNGEVIENRRDLTEYMTPEAVQVFSAAQGIQDAGETWGDAADGAAKYYEAKYKNPVSV